MTANPITHQYSAKLNRQVRQDLDEHGDQAGHQEARHGASGDEPLRPAEGLQE